MSITRLIPLPFVLAAVAAWSVVTASAGPAAPAVAPPPVFVVTGGGWGHGVGMSQWGAYGQAQAGRAYDEILATYYRGTELEKTAKRAVRVLMAEGVAAAAFSATGPIVVSDGAGRRFRIRGGGVTIPAGLVATIDAKRKNVVLVPPVRVEPTLGVQISYGDVPRRGAYVVQPSTDGLLVVNEVAMEAYLRGVVPGEMPHEWPLEALKAQAVAARTYALAGLLADKPYDLYADVRSQVYGGIPAERESTDTAVRETAGRILDFDGTPARTLYFSSSGGRTLSALEVFGVDVPYLKSIPDPWDRDSPNHRWQPRTFTAAALARAVGLPSPVAQVGEPEQPAGAVKVAAVPPPGPTRIRLASADGTAVDLTLSDARSRLGLLSTGFRLGVLALRQAESPPLAGRVVALSGTARDVDEPTLERRRADGTWQRARRLVPLADGSFSVGVQPRVTTTFRVTGSGVTGPEVTVVVPSA